MYAILIAFVIVDEYTQLRSAQNEISDKAAALSTLYENSRAFPTPQGDLLRTRTLDYARAFSEHTMPHLGDEASSRRITDRKLEERLPRGPGHRAEDASRRRPPTTRWSPSLDSVVRTRSDLVGAAKSTVPLTLLVLLFVIGLTVMAVAATLDTRHHDHTCSCCSRSRWSSGDPRARRQPRLPVQRHHQGVRRARSRLRPVPRQRDEAADRSPRPPSPTTSHAGPRAAARAAADAGSPSAALDTPVSAMPGRAARALIARS